MGLGDWWAQNVTGSGPNQDVYSQAQGAQAHTLGRVDSDLRNMYSQGPVRTSFDQANQDRSGAMQGQNMLMAQANGQGPSAAQVGAQNAMGNANNQINSLALTRQAATRPG